MPNLITRTSDALKAASAAWRFGRGGGSGGTTNAGSIPYWVDNKNRGLSATLGTTGEKINYRAKVGEFTDNSAVFACLLFLMRNYPSAPVRVRDRTSKKVIEGHPLEQLLAFPTMTPHVSYSTLSCGINMSYFGNGNAYFFKVRDGAGRVRELWYRPHWMVKPIREPGSNNFIDYYAYKPDDQPGTKVVRMEASDVVHLRFGFDPKNEMLGMSPLRGLLETIYTEQEANAFLASVLTNLGVVGGVLTYKPTYQQTQDGIGEWSTLPTETAQGIKSQYAEDFTGGKRGALLILDGDFNMQFPTPAFDSGLAERSKKIAQADIAAAFGLPPAVVGFLVGLEHQDARAAHESMLRQAYDSCLCPTQRDHAADLSLQLLPDFDPRPLRANGERAMPTTEVFYDYTSVPAMQESQDALWKRAGDAYARGGLTRAEYRQIIGQTVSPGDLDQVYVVPKGSILVPQTMNPAELLELLTCGADHSGEDDKTDDTKDDDDPPTGGKPPKEPGKGKDKKP